MNYSPVTAVWEITMGCNMRCMHCGSACEKPLPDELSTSEALSLCHDIADLGLQWITLSGGEPFTRLDWHRIARELTQKGVHTNIISNGWLITEDTVAKAIDSNVGTIAISLDGMEETHDFIRKKGSFKRVMNSLELMKAKNVSCGVITTINTENIQELTRLKELLSGLGVLYWQVQIGLPMGTFKQNDELVLGPSSVDEIIDFCYDVMKEGALNIFPADCLGYYNLKELEVRRYAHRSRTLPLWKGCNAGKRSFGILHNGEILGCTSIRDRKYIEGGIRETPLKEIWESDATFLWNREARKSNLEGVCGICKYGDECLGGCPNTRLTMGGKMEAENEYCSYNLAMKQTRNEIASRTDLEELKAKGRESAEQKEFQLAGAIIHKVLYEDPENIEFLNYYGYVNFFLNNFDECLEANKKVLALEPENAYANKGMGLALHRLGDSEKGISFLKKAIGLTDANYMDPYYDLAVVYTECNNRQKARETLEKGRNISPEFARQSEALYRSLCV